MATEAEIRADLQEATALFINYIDQQTVNADADSYTVAPTSAFRADQETGKAAFTSSAAAVLTDGRNLILPVLVSYCNDVLNVPERTAKACLDRLFTDFVDRAITIQERAFVYGATTADGGNTGDGVVRRLVIDEAGFNIENAFADTKTLKCIAAANGGAFKHEELFELRGENAGANLLDLKVASGSGSGKVNRNAEVIKALTSRNSIARNSGFFQFQIAGTVALLSPYTMVAGDVLTNWTVDDITQLGLDADEIFKDIAGVALPTSLRLDGNVLLTQTFDLAQVQLDFNTPYERRIAWQRRATADGTLRIGVGNKDESVDVTTGTNGIWNILQGTLDADLWPINFSEEDALFDIQLSANTTGNILIAEFMVPRMFSFDGLWHMIHGGRTTFQEDDFFTWIDTIASDAKIQKALWILFGRYLPSAAVPTFADPA